MHGTRATAVISRNANGPSGGAFESNATNLAAADRAPDYDVYVRNLRTRRTLLVSTAQTGAVHPTIDGGCELVSYEAAGNVYVRDLLSKRTYRVAGGTEAVQQADGKGVVFVRSGQIYRQAFERIHNHGHPKLVLRGHARLVSAGIHGAGNGASAHPSVSDNGKFVAFESNATNLCTDVCTGLSQDRNGTVTDVFRRSLKKHGRGMMQMASFSLGVDSQGHGPSNDAAITGAGQFIAFDSAATNLRPSYSIHEIDPNGPTRDVYLWNARGHSGAGNVSRESRPGVKGALNGPSIAPAISSHGNYLAFASNEVGQLSGTGQALPNVLMRFLGGK